MKISIIAKPKSANDFEIKELIKAAQKQGIEINTLDIESLDKGRLEPVLKQMGEVVFWYDASIEIDGRRLILFEVLKKNGKHIFNSGIANKSTIPYKYFQQKYLSELTNLPAIPTFTFKGDQELLAAVGQGKLKFPIVAKPNLGMKGEGVELLKTKEDIKKLDEEKYAKYIFQKSIPNSGDFRVLVLGGKAVAAMKRIAQKGKFVNNFSQGGSIQPVNDSETREEIMRLAEQVAASFNLSACGVDVIFDEQEKKFYLMEINTMLSWKGLQRVTKQNIAEEFIKLLTEVGSGQKKPIVDRVKSHYDANLDYLRDRRTHYLSRTFFWTGSKKAEQELKKVQEKYIGITPEQIKTKIKQTLEIPVEHYLKRLKGREKRAEYFRRYPLLENYNTILFKVILMDKLQGQDIRPYVREIIPDEKFIELKEQLTKDKVALTKISTHAVNYLYHLEYYLQKEMVDRKDLLELARKSYKDESMDEIMLKLYFYTHCIIGESHFYTQAIKSDQKPVYQEILKEVEKSIFNNYFEISLDNKFEFLVCARMLDFRTPLKQMINNEAEYSFSDSGNYLVESFGRDAAIHQKKNLLSAEHRNILFLMANTEWIHSDK